MDAGAAVPRNVVKTAAKLQPENFLMKTESILYILVRNDLQSMNPGKAMAQASHATSLCTAKARASDSLTNSLWQEWESSTSQSFGTVLVLSVSDAQLAKFASEASNLDNSGVAMTWGIVTDPTYPYSTTVEIANLISATYDTLPRFNKGAVTHLHRNEITCGFVFGNKEQLKDLLKDFPLHP